MYTYIVCLHVFMIISVCIYIYMYNHIYMYTYVYIYIKHVCKYVCLGDHISTSVCVIHLLFLYVSAVLETSVYPIGKTSSDMFINLIQLSMVNTSRLPGGAPKLCLLVYTM